MTSLSYEQLINKRMDRFMYLIDQAKLTFNQHQYDGVKWCLQNELKPNPIGNCRGGFIADEMGLGKTIMMIGTMFSNYMPKTLIVVPPVLIKQWYNEIHRVTGHSSCMYYGSNKHQVTMEKIMSSPIILTSYHMLQPDTCLLKNIVWNRIIFDEAHHLRNSNTKRFKTCKSLRSRIRWFVTGTPVQNKKSDFYSLCYALGLKPSFYTESSNLPILCDNFILRRTKKQVGIELPPVNKNKCLVEWKNETERMLSQEIHSLLPNQTHVLTSNKKYNIANCFAQKGGTFTAILRAKQSCVMPSLMRRKMEEFVNDGMLENEVLEALDYTSKLDAVIALILSRKDNEKGKIIFCHYRDEIDMIVERLLNGGMKKVISYDGRSSGSSKLETLSEPADAIVIQIQTGSEGLNLQKNFSEIYFVSPHWNPFVEDQAIARCHRIGQTKPVDVFKFEMRGFAKDANAELNPRSLEKYIVAIQQEKRKISRMILNYSQKPNEVHI